MLTSASMQHAHNDSANKLMLGKRVMRVRVMITHVNTADEEMSLVCSCSATKEGL